MIFISLLTGSLGFAQAEPISDPAATVAAPTSDLAPELTLELPPSEQPVHAPGHLKTTRTPDFSKPVYFDPTEENILARPTISYRLDPKAPGSLKLGPVEISEKTFFVEYKSFDELLGVKAAKGAASQPKSLFLAWPDALFTEGKIEIISEGGRIVWKQEFINRHLDDFRRWIGPQQLPAGVSPQVLANLKSTLRFKIENLEREPIWTTENPAFRICITQNKSPHYSRLCTRTLRTRLNGKDVILGKLQLENAPRLLINNQPKEFIGRQQVSFKQNVS
ncbi:MAG: hypothetical protein V4736_11530, partial [Bdellovibrionota bacterium]